MLTLSADTSTNVGSLALFDDSGFVAVRTWDRMNSHCELIITEFEKLMLTTNKNIKDIKRLAVGLGPGSFTGIRVAVNFIKTLGYALNIPVVHFNSLHLLASQVSENSLPIMTVQYGFRNLLYLATYKLDKGLVIETSTPQAITIEECIFKTHSPHLVLGSGYLHCRPLLNHAQNQLFTRSDKFLDHPQADFFGFLKPLFSQPHHFSQWKDVEPLYIRASEAEEKLKSRETT